MIDLDDLEQLCPVDAVSRHGEVGRAEELARGEAEGLERWIRVRAMTPAIVQLRQEGDDIRRHELRRATTQLGTLSAEQLEAVDRVTRSIVNRFLHHPTLALRQSAGLRRAPRLPNVQGAAPPRGRWKAVPPRL